MIERATGKNRDLERRTSRGAKGGRQRAVTAADENPRSSNEGFGADGISDVHGVELANPEARIGPQDLQGTIRAPGSWIEEGRHRCRPDGKECSRAHDASSSVPTSSRFSMRLTPGIDWTARSTSST